MHWQPAHTSTYPPPSPSPGGSQPAQAQGETLVGREAERRWGCCSGTSEHGLALRHPKYHTAPDLCPGFPFCTRCSFPSSAPSTSPTAPSPARSKPDPTMSAVPQSPLQWEQNNLAAPGRQRCFEACLAAELVVTGLRALPSLCWATEERLCLDPTQRARCLVVLKPILL